MKGSLNDERRESESESMRYRGAHKNSSWRGLRGFEGEVSSFRTSESYFHYFIKFYGFFTNIFGNLGNLNPKNLSLAYTPNEVFARFFLQKYDEAEINGPVKT